MFDSHAFFKNRFSEHLKETSRYLRYIFTGHLAIAMLFFISAIAVYYQQWLQNLSENFPTAWVVGIVFGLVASYSPVRTLLKEPDLVFLIAAENKMNAYFRDALLYSFVIQLYLVLLAAAALGPLYSATYPEREGYLLTVLVLLIFKVWNLLANWWMLKIRAPGVRQIDLLARTLLTIAVFYFLIHGDIVLTAVTTGLYIIVFLYDYNLSHKQAGIVWDLLIQKDRDRMQAFYRIANMFTDVPHLRSKVKKRQWLTSIVSNVPFQNKQSFHYLYRITFVRSGDYLGMYLRLIVIGGLFIYFVPQLWMKILFALLFMYMSSFQMMTLYHHHRTVMWIDLYPVEHKYRRQAVFNWLFQLGLVQTILFAIVFLFTPSQFTGAGIILVCGFLFNYLFMNGYVKRKLV
ncbi:ABC transporter permease [Virgibacillus phasianinus]|uniref:ABC transporter permease n=1 Tax=Virgibacillus phasianinus TaxID=2017483 RepID=A0A220TYU9_9BACI|nr:ABC transporter permease [Virgibacillus phasianinus]ASK60861.1 ABC transporter permease [Virgibacillus phasianinus]